MLGGFRIFRDRVMLLEKLGKLRRMRSLRFGDVVRPATSASATLSNVAQCVLRAAGKARPTNSIAPLRCDRLKPVASEASCTGDPV